MPKLDKELAVRITGQFRRQRAMLYDLKCGQIRITISIAQEAEPSDNWSVDAVAKLTPTPLSMGVVGPTRGEALDALVAEWCDRGASGGFPLLDWKLIREALSAVRAI